MQFSCTIQIDDKPDWNKLGPEIMNNFLSPLAEMVKVHNAGRLNCNFLNRPDCRLLVEYTLEEEYSTRKSKPVYAGHIKDDARVAILELYKNHPYPDERISLKEFLVQLADFFVKTFKERTEQYAEVAAIGVIMEETMGRLRSIKATAHSE